MSKIAFLVTKEPHIAFGQIGIEIMASLLKADGHHVIGLVETMFDPSLQITSTEEKNVEILEEFDPDFVGFSVATHRYQWYLKFARLVKKSIPDVKIIFGGPHPTILPEVVAREKCVDYVCVGEGEGPIQDLVKDPERKDILNIYPNPLRPLIQDLDSLPFPDKTIWLKYGVGKDTFKSYLIIASRGCPFNCCYCFNAVQKSIFADLGKWVRYRSVDNVIQELKIARRKFPVEFVLFMDDNLGLNKEWLREFSLKYKKEIDIPYTGNTDPMVMDAEKLQLLKDSGCRFLMFGIQSGNEYARKEIIGRLSSNEHIRKIAKVCHDIKLPFSLDHLFNVPGMDEPQFLKESALFYKELNPFTINTYRLYLLPKTPVLRMFSLTKEFTKKMEKGVHQEPTIRAISNVNYVNYRNVFVFLPLLPAQLLKKVVTKDYLLTFFGNVPECFIWLIKGFNNLRGGNEYLVREYLKALPRFVKQRLRGYKGEFQIPVLREEK